MVDMGAMLPAEKVFCLLMLCAVFENSFTRL